MVEGGGQHRQGAGAAAARATAVEDRWSTTTGGVRQRWMGEDGGSGHLGVEVAAMAAAAAVAAAGGGIFYAL